MTQKTIKKDAEEYYVNNIFCDGITEFEHDIAIRCYIAGAKDQAERMYSEEEVLKFIKYLLSKKVTRARSISELEEYLPKEFQLLSGELMENGKELLSEWFEQFKKNKI
jgi:hypothetical protein